MSANCRRSLNLSFVEWLTRRSIKSREFNAHRHRAIGREGSDITGEMRDLDQAAGVLEVFVKNREVPPWPLSSSAAVNAWAPTVSLRFEFLIVITSGSAALERESGPAIAKSAATAITGCVKFVFIWGSSN